MAFLSENTFQFVIAASDLSYFEKVFFANKVEFKTEKITADRFRIIVDEVYKASIIENFSDIIIPNEERKASLSDQIADAKRPDTTTNFESPKNNLSSEKKDFSDLRKDLGILSLEEKERMEERAAQAAAEKKEPRKKKKLGRDNQFKTRLTDREMEKFLKRVETSGMKQGDFMRECMLKTKLNVRSLTGIDEQALVQMMEIAADLGRVGGLIKGVVMTNKNEFKVLTFEEKEELEALIRELNNLKSEIEKVVQDLYGNS